MRLQKITVARLVLFIGKIYEHIQNYFNMYNNFVYFQELILYKSEKKTVNLNIFLK